jgi:predicted RNase H-like HicB family nuclease
VSDVFAYLVRHRDRVVSKDELLAELWPRARRVILVGSCFLSPHRMVHNLAPARDVPPETTTLDVAEAPDYPPACRRAGRFSHQSWRQRGRAMKLPVILERDETGMVVAECPAIPGCVSQGLTEDEAIANIREAMIACLEVRAEQGLPLTVRTVEVDVAVA